MNGRVSLSRVSLHIVGGEIPIRVPALPYQTAFDLYASGDLRAHVRGLITPQLLAALLLASPDMYEQAVALRDTGECASAALEKLAAYILRMCSRPTPYGLFSAVGLAAIGQGEPPRLTGHVWTRSRADVAWLQQYFDSRIGGEPADDELLFFTDLALAEGERLYVTAPVRLTDRQRAEYAQFSLAFGPAIAALRDAAREPRSVAVLVDVLVRLGAQEQAARSVISTLVRHGVLLRSAGVVPIGDPLERFGTPETDEVRGRLAELDAAGSDAQRLARISQIRTRMQELVPDNPHPLQIDLGCEVEGSLPPAVLHDASVLAQTFLRLAYRDDMAQYVRSFVERYEGADRLVPLVELADAGLGLGAPPVKTDDFSTPPGTGMFAELAARALKNGRLELSLSNAEYEAAFPEPEWLAQGKFVPRSFEFGFQVWASSREDLAGGRYTVAPAHFPASLCAGASFGRFAHLFGERGAQLFRSLAHADAESGAIDAEIVFLPMERRAINVALRPPSFEHRIEVGVRTHQDGTVIPASDLFVGCNEEGLYLYSASLKRRVVPHQTCMLNTVVTAPSVVQLLVAIAQASTYTVGGFTWGHLTYLPFLPRLCVGRTILTFARWKRRFEPQERGDRARFADAFSRWADEWNVPRHVWYVQRDTRLLIDRHSALGLTLLYDNVRRSEEPITIEEAPHAGSVSWLDEVPRNAEFVCSVRCSGRAQDASLRAVPIAPDCGATAMPGSEWVYAKVYCSSENQDSFIGTVLRELVERMKREDLLDRWFFLRYADPLPHLRIRFRARDLASAPLVRDIVQDAIANAASRLGIRRFAFDTYAPEFERYGGVDGVEHCESLFALSSSFAAGALVTRPSSPDDRIARAVRSFAPIAFAVQCIDENADFQAPRKSLNAAQRDVSKALQAELLDASTDGAFQAAIERCREALERYRVAGGPDASQPFTQKFLDDILHMHLNRCGITPQTEPLARAMVRGTLRAVAKRSADARLIEA